MFKTEYLPTRASIGRCVLLIGLLILIWVIENSSISSLIGIQALSYIVAPFLWFGAAWIVWLFPKVRANVKRRQVNSINGWAFIFAFIFVVAIFLIGIFVDGVGKSPYSHSIIGMSLNILAVGSALIGREFIRSYLVNSMTKTESYIVFVPIALLMTLVTTSFNGIINLNGYQDLVKFVAQYAAPELMHNLFATYLSFLGGPMPAIIYLGVIQGTYWLSPILPDLQWLTAALVGVMVPVFSLGAMQNIHLKESKRLKAKDKAEESVLSWIITSLLSIGIIWFSVGVFPVYPSVIATGSMEPMIKPGDVILVRKLTDEEGMSHLKVGDVIQFKSGNILISHRIIDIVDDGNEVSYQTKGDNNSVADSELVKPEQIKGSIAEVVPKLGWPTLLLKQNNVPIETVEF